AALGVRSVAIPQLRLREEQHVPVLAREQRGVQSGETASDDDQVVALHGLMASIRSTERRAFSMTSGGTSTSRAIFTKQSRRFSRVIIFIYWHVASSSAAMKRFAGISLWRRWSRPTSVAMRKVLRGDWCA